MPTKLARTDASSVCGRVSHCNNVTTAATAAPVTINAPSTRPATRRPPGSPSPWRSVIRLDPEQRHPKDESAREHGDADTDRGAEHPRGKERADDVDLRSQAFAPYRSGTARASDVSPVVNASAAEASNSWALVSSST